ncbi:MAG: MauE/DoxX family redox-associated membrane protein [Acidimicrobiales bacterium]
MTFFGLYLVACELLGVAGAAKVLRPDDTARAVHDAIGGRLTVLRSLVRALAATEALLGLVGFAYPDPAAAIAVSASYAGFACFVLAVRARGGSLATCGCFGKPDTPPTVTHAVLDGALCGAAAAVAASGITGELPQVLSRQYFEGIPLLVAGAACAWLAYLVLALQPRLGALRAMDPRAMDVGAGAVGGWS